MIDETADALTWLGKMSPEPFDDLAKAPRKGPGTATFLAGDSDAAVIVTLSQIRGQIPTKVTETVQFLEIPGFIGGPDSVIPRVPFSWTLGLLNSLGWKPGKATLSVTAVSFDPRVGDYTSRTLSGSIVLPK